MDGVTLLVEADIVSIMKNKNDVCQYALMMKLCVISINRVKNLRLILIYERS